MRPVLAAVDPMFPCAACYPDQFPAQGISVTPAAGVLQCLVAIALGEAASVGSRTRRDARSGAQAGPEGLEQSLHMGRGKEVSPRVTSEMSWSASPDPAR